MNNQSAQTMPECTCPDNGGCTNPCDRKAFQAVPLSEELLIDAAILSGNTPQERRLQKVMTQAAAALSQTAGVPYGWLHAVEYVDGTCPPEFVKGADKPKGHLDQVDEKIRHIVAETFVADHFTPLYAAPAASGGEDDRSGWCRSDGCVHKKFGEPIWKTGDNPFQSSRHPDALQDGTRSKSTAKRVEALAAASVSERARELLAVQFDGRQSHVAYAIRHAPMRELNTDLAAGLTALEQALTQQRRECPRTWPCAKHPRAEIKTDGFPIEPLKVFDLGPWTWTETGHQFTGIDLDGAAFSAYRDYFNGTTTPQPSADAVRELVKRWRVSARAFGETEYSDGARDAFSQCARELETLLSGGSHA